jgi:hypothetical protein
MAVRLAVAFTALPSKFRTGSRKETCLALSTDHHQSDYMSIDNTSESGRIGDIERPSVEFDAQKAKASAGTDEVFGDIREGGPNYRNVSSQYLASR